MKTLSYFVIFVFLFTQLVSLAKPYKPEVSGGFRSCNVVEFRYNSGKLVKKSGEKRYDQFFDSNGNQIELVSYSEGKIVSTNKIENQYDKKGLLIKTTYFDTKGKPFFWFTYEYDAKSNRIADHNFDKNGSETATTKYKIDDSGFIVQADYFALIDGKLGFTNSIYYKNDQHGNPIEEFANHSSSFSVTASSEIDLESNHTNSGVKIEDSKKLDNLDKIIYKYTYDDKGNMIKYVRIGIDNFTITKEFKYDNYGNLKEEIYPDEKGKIALKVVYEYSK